MREIKFRAWHREEKKMISVDELLNLWSQYQPDNETGESGLYREPDVRVINQSYKGKDLELVVGRSCDLMQYTGLKGKNGKEIYEGDIVKFCHGNTQKEENWSVGKIIWDVVGYRFALRPSTPMNALYDSSCYEVIGNIHQHPELLKEKGE